MVQKSGKASTKCACCEKKWVQTDTKWVRTDKSCYKSGMFLAQMGVFLRKVKIEHAHMIENKDKDS